MTVGCRKPEMQRCVDKDLTVVDDDLCHATGEQRILGKKPEASGTYRYYYGGTGSTESGTHATGGSYLRLSDRTYAVASTKRGGFGKSWPAYVIGGVIAGALILFGVGE